MELPARYVSPTPAGRTRLRIGGLLLLLAVLVFLGFTLDTSVLLDPDRLRRLAQENVWKASGLFILAGAAIKLLFMPVSPLSVLAGVIFGGLLGGVLTLVTLTGSSIVAFGAARWLGRDWVRRTIDVDEGKARFVERLLLEHGVLAVIVLRVIPTLPLAAVNMLLGVSAVRWRAFVIGTTLGLLPGTLLLSYVGSEALQPAGWRFWLYLALFGALVVLGIGIGAWMRRRMEA